ncbi:MAG: hypothetical protein ACI8RD_005942 [Bacillariaceae sp.]|jgi:hypothetical protein
MKKAKVLLLLLVAWVGQQHVQGGSVGSAPEETEYSLPDFETDEEETEYYGPLDRFWRAHAVNRTLVLGDTDYYPTIENCLNGYLSQQDWIDIRQPQNLDRQLGERFIDRKVKGPVFLVEIKNAMSPIHAKAVRALKDCVKTHISQLFESRPMYQVYEVAETENQTVKDKMGGNNPTHLNSIIGLFLPDVVKEQYISLNAAYHYAGWQQLVVKSEIEDKFRAKHAFTPIHQAGMRACEYLSYEGFNNLMEHQDGYATAVVLNVFLSKGTDYEGGAFYIKDKVLKEYHSVRPEQYSALAFLGGTFDHGVDTIHSGNREALSTEFWYYPDLPFGVNLCAAEFDNVEQHIRQCNVEQRNQNNDGYDYTIPCSKEFPSYSEYGVCISHMGTVKEKNVYKDPQEQEHVVEEPKSAGDDVDGEL